PLVSIAVKHDEILALLRRLEEWLSCTDRLLRQRAGRSDVADAGDRFPLYRGSVQKLLYLADKLINDFASSVRPARPPRFTVIHDTGAAVASLPYGFVRIPTSQIFNLPAVVPDLWHEVGVSLFLREYAWEVGRYALASERGEFITNVAEHYADLIVYLYGFKGSLTKFTTSVISRWRETYRELPYAASSAAVGQLLSRLYLVYEFDAIRDAL